MTKTYLELSRLKTFEERFEYLKLGGKAFDPTFGASRHLNQAFYTSKEWRQIRNKVIDRDNACDLGVEGHEIYGEIIVHHINPILVEDFDEHVEKLTDLNNLICVSYYTHLAITYGNIELLPSYKLVERHPNDTSPWRI